MQQLQAFPFQYKLRDHFKGQVKTWEWFQNKNVQKEQIENFKTDLLKNAYRIDVASEERLYEILQKAKDKLGIPIPITLYQSLNIDMNNGAIVFFENEAHLILSGTVLKLLNEDELLSLFGHELSHIKLYTLDNGELEITNRIINAIAEDRNSELFYSETARIFQLYTELFCDLGALKVTENRDVVIATLVKLHTGLEKVSAESYLKQADEILEKIESGSSGESHPEIYIRAKSLALLDDNETDTISKIEKLVAGKIDLQLLNIFSKEDVYILTKDFIDIILKAKWLQSEHNIVLYKQYFKEFAIKKSIIIDEDFNKRINKCKDNIKNYLCYIMYDFALCDKEITEPAIAQMLDIAEQLEIESFLKIIIKKEMKLTEKAYKDYIKKSSITLNQILESEGEASY